MNELIKQNNINNETKLPRGNPNWLRGNSGNPKGRPKKAEIDKLRKALEYGEQKFGKDIFYHAIERAFKNDQVLIALLKKLVPDKLEGVGFDTKIIFNQIKQIIENANRNNRTPESSDRPETLARESDRV